VVAVGLILRLLMVALLLALIVALAIAILAMRWLHERPRRL